MDYTVFMEEFLDEIYRFVKRVTLYVNTWDWKLFSSKLWNWSHDRIGAMIMKENKFDCIDVTQLLSSWIWTSNHYYLTNKYFKMDIIQSLSKIGGVDPKYRNYVLPVYEDQNEALLNNAKYYELVDKPFMKIVPQKTQNQRVNEVEEGDTKQPEDEEQEKIINQKDMETVTENLRVLGYVDDEEQELEQANDPEITGYIEMDKNDNNNADD